MVSPVRFNPSVQNGANSISLKTYIAQKGDTLAVIASKAGVTVASILDSNKNITDYKSGLRTNQRVVLPENSNQLYTVKSGDTLSGIAAKYGIKNYKEIATLNAIDSKAVLKLGQQLFIPKNNITPTNSSPPEPRLDAFNPNQIEQIYFVKSGDTLSGIAAKYGIKNYKEIATLNGIDSKAVLKVGQRLVIPQNSSSNKSTPAPLPASEKQKPQSPERIPLDPMRPKEGMLYAQANDSAIVSYLDGLLGTPYGPVYPKKNADTLHLDCVTSISKYAKDMYGIKFNYSSNDMVYARHTTPVTTIKPGQINLDSIQPGDIVFLGKPYEKGEGGISAAHAYIVGEPIKDENGNTSDFYIYNASGSYWGDSKYWNTNFGGKGFIKETLMAEFNEKKRNPEKNHMFVARFNVVDTSSLLASN